MKEYNTKQRLRQIMEEKGLRQVDILSMAKPYCEKYNIRLGKNDLSQYLHGKAEPKQDKLTVLSLALGVDATWLMGYDVPMKSDGGAYKDENVLNFLDNVDTMTTKRVPRLGVIACGEPILAQQNIEEYDSVPDFVKCDFTLVCNGDSMTGARINDGDIVCIRQQPTVENGQIAAVLIDGEFDNYATLKRVSFQGDAIILMPENSKYTPMVYTGEDKSKVRILGLATHFISKVV